MHNEFPGLPLTSTALARSACWSAGILLMLCVASQSAAQSAGAAGKHRASKPASGSAVPSFADDCRDMMKALPTTAADLPALLTNLEGQKQVAGVDLAACHEQLRRWTVWFVSREHSAISARSSAAQLERVAGLYRSYFKHFAEASDSAQMHYYLAEVLWTLAERESRTSHRSAAWQRAAEAFSRSIRTVSALRRSLRKEAAYAAVLAWKNALSELQPAVSAPPRSTNSAAVSPTPLTSTEQKMIAAFHDYDNYVSDPADPERLVMRFMEARVYWRHDKLDMAIPLFWSITVDHMDKEVGPYAATLLLDSLIRAEKFSQLERVVRELSANKGALAANPELGRTVGTLAQQIGRRRAEDFERDGKFGECGKTYRELAISYPQSERADELHYNSGVCFEMDRSVGLALVSYGHLLRHFPRSPHARKALVRSANLQASIGLASSLRSAAASYERYARQYSGEKDAPKALNNAITYRWALGELDAADKNIQLTIRLYKNKISTGWAQLMWAHARRFAEAGDQAGEERTLRRYLKLFAARGGRAYGLMANARLGSLLWSASCPVRTVDGLCIKVGRSRPAVPAKAGARPALPTQCGPASARPWVVVARNRRKADEAVGYLRAAVKLGQRGLSSSEHDPGQRVEAIRWQAAASFYLAEESYERALDVPFPKRLNFDSAKPEVSRESQRRFTAWLQESQKRFTVASEAYRAVSEIKGGGVQWSVAATARSGQLAQAFANALRTASIPVDIRKPPHASDKVQVYCEALQDKAKPLEDRAVAAYEACLQRAQGGDWPGTWSRLCQRHLYQLRPQDHPLGRERTSRPGVAPIVDTAGLATSVQP